MLGSALFYELLARELHAWLQGKRLVYLYSVAQQELYIEFDNQAALKYHLLEGFPMLVPLEQHFRPSDGCLPRLNPVHGLEVLSVSAVPNDRAFYISLEDGWQLLFKMYGSRSNIVLLQHGEVKDLYLRNLAKDWELSIARMQKPSPDPACPLEDLGRQYPYLTQEVLLVLEAFGYRQMPVQALERLYAGNWSWGIGMKAGEMPALLPWGLVPEQEGPYAQLKEAVNDLYRRFSNTFFLEKARVEVLASLQKQKAQLERSLAATEGALQSMQSLPTLEQKGHLVMSSIHLLQPGATRLETEDYFNGGKVIVTLDAKLDAVQNAERYYRKSRNQREQEAGLWKKLEELLAQLPGLDAKMALARETSRIKELKQFQKTLQKQSDEEQLPYKRYQYRGYTILVGKNAQSNDLITRQAHKNDLWLHAKDVSGSHVVVKVKPGTAFPSDVIERAASLAAYYSKQRNESLASVVYTEKKYVRKPKGGAPGLVKLDRETGILVRPEP